MMLTLALALPMALLKPPAVGRRAIICGAGASVTCAPLAAVAAADPGAAGVQQLLRGQAVLEDVLARWKELTIDCNYGEIRRELLEQDSKEALLKAASTTSKSATMVTVCKTSGRLVREALGADQSPLNNLSKLLEKPAVVQRVDYDDFEVTATRPATRRKLIAECQSLPRSQAPRARPSIHCRPSKRRARSCSSLSPQPMRPRTFRLRCVSTAQGSMLLCTPSSRLQCT